MATTYSTPGVYVEEVPPAARPIAGIGTSTAGFIGVVLAPYSKVEPNQPTLVTNWTQFVDYFGDFQSLIRDALKTLKSLQQEKSKLDSQTKIVEALTEAAKTAATAAETDSTKQEAAKAAKEKVDPATNEQKKIQESVTSIEKHLAQFEALLDPEKKLKIEGLVNEIAEVQQLEKKAQEAEEELKTAPLDQTKLQAAKEARGKAKAAEESLKKRREGFRQNCDAYGNFYHAIYGFFNNGGARCYVVRVESLDDLTEPLKALETIDEITIIAVPGATAQQQHAAILGHCYKLGDRVAILDGVNQEQPAAPDEKTIAPEARNSESGSYGAVYFPWIKVFDANEKKVNSTGDGLLVVPPSGHIAGIYARSDNARGVHKAPANEVVLGALGVARLVTKEQQGGLNDANINVIRSFNGTIKVWGARTRQLDKPEFQYISTRRFFNFMRESIEEGTQWVVFEPNNKSLWQRIIRSVSDFLLEQWRAGALFGDTPKQAFYVKCDDETNHESLRKKGQVVTEIGVAIVKPAEFVIFRIQQTTGS